MYSLRVEIRGLWVGTNVRVGQQCVHCGVEIRGLWVGTNVRVGQQRIHCGVEIRGYRWGSM